MAAPRQKIPKIDPSFLAAFRILLIFGLAVTLVYSGDILRALSVAVSVAFLLRILDRGGFYFGKRRAKRPADAAEDHLLLWTLGVVSVGVYALSVLRELQAV